MRFGTFFSVKKNQRRRRFILLLLFFFFWLCLCVLCVPQVRKKKVVKWEDQWAKKEKPKWEKVGGSLVCYKPCPFCP